MRCLEFYSGIGGEHVAGVFRNVQGRQLITTKPRAWLHRNALCCEAKSPGRRGGLCFRYKHRR